MRANCTRSFARRSCAVRRKRSLGYEPTGVVRMGFGAPTPLYDRLPGAAACTPRRSGSWLGANFLFPPYADSQKVRFSGIRSPPRACVGSGRCRIRHAAPSVTTPALSPQPIASAWQRSSFHVDPSRSHHRPAAFVWPGEGQQMRASGRLLCAGLGRWHRSFALGAASALTEAEAFGHGRSGGRVIRRH